MPRQAPERGMGGQLTAGTVFVMLKVKGAAVGAAPSIGFLEIAATHNPFPDSSQHCRHLFPVETRTLYDYEEIGIACPTSTFGTRMRICIDIVHLVHLR